MTAINFSTPVFEGAIHGISFFNGRLLSGEDLTQEQTANREGRKLLGRAIGEGVVNGLQVSKKKVAAGTLPQVTVLPGLAINREGRALQLANPVDIFFRYSASAQSAPITNLFATCGEGDMPLFTTVDDVYLLVICASDVGVGRAPVSGLGNIDAGCNSRYNVEGVTFRLLALEADVKEPLKLRNRVASQCIVTPEVSADPFGPALEPSGTLDVLRDAGTLTDCDVPLAVIYWESNDIRFVDLWSVRRRVTAPSYEGHWSAWLGDNIVSGGEARFLQFQNHVEDLRTYPLQENYPGVSNELSKIVATDRFDWLPAAGILPIIGEKSATGFDWKKFFGGLAPQDVDITDADMLPALLRQSFYHGPIKVSSPTSDKVRLYLIRENYDQAKSNSSVQLAMLFASRTLPYCGVARFAYAKWDVTHFI